MLGLKSLVAILCSLQGKFGLSAHFYKDKDNLLTDLLLLRLYVAIFLCFGDLCSPFLQLVSNFSLHQIAQLLQVSIKWIHLRFYTVSCMYLRCSN